MNTADYHACLTGDCPHERQEECTKSLADEIRRQSDVNSLLILAIDELSKGGSHGEDCGVLKLGMPGGIANPANCNCWKRYLREAEKV